MKPDMVVQKNEDLGVFILKRRQKREPCVGRGQPRTYSGKVDFWEA